MQGPERWWVLHTRPRAEKVLARHCHKRELPFFLPLYHRKWRSRGRLQSSFLPLFPGYVFLLGGGDVRLAALETNLVAQVIPVNDQRQLHEDLARAPGPEGARCFPAGRDAFGQAVQPCSNRCRSPAS